jgi:hypothetical protein
MRTIICSARFTVPAMRFARGETSSDPAVGAALYLLRVTHINPHTAFNETPKTKRRFRYPGRKDSPLATVKS